MKALVTGGAGFIGYHLARNLANDGHEVALCDNLFRGRRDTDLNDLLDLPNVTLCELDLTDRSQLDQLPTDSDVIFNLAAINGTRYFYEIPYKVIRTNLLSLVNMLDWMSQTACKAFIWPSSSEVYAGSVEAYSVPVPTPENVPLTITDVSNPRFSYAGSKIAGELLCSHYAETKKIKVTIVRPHNVYGPRMGYEHVIPQFIVRILERQDPFKMYGGDQSRAFCYVDDFVRGMVSAAELSTNGDVRTINIGNDQEVVIQEMAESLFKMSGFHPNIDLLPSPEGSVDRRCPDLTLARSLLKYEPRVDLGDGLQRTFEWYVANYSTGSKSPGRFE